MCCRHMRSGDAAISKKVVVPTLRKDSVCQDGQPQVFVEEEPSIEMGGVLLHVFIQINPQSSREMEII